MKFIKKLKIVISFIALVIIIIYNLNSVKITRENRIHNYKKIELLRLESDASEKIKKIENEQIYDSIDDFPYDSMAVVNDNTFKTIKNVYDNIKFYGEFDKGNIELYDLYREKFVQLLKCTV